MMTAAPAKSKAETGYCARVAQWFAHWTIAHSYATSAVEEPTHFIFLL